MEEVTSRNCHTTCCFGQRSTTCTTYEQRRVDGALSLPGDFIPTTISINNVICNWAPLPSDAESSKTLATGDVVKIQLGAQLDGYPAVAAETIVVGADAKPVSLISREIGDLAARARDGKLQPHEYQGGTASLSNMGMYGIKQFDAVINPPQAMILAVGAGEKRPWVEGEELTVATVMSITGSFDHRAIDGADGARLMKTLKELIESPLGLVA